MKREENTFNVVTHVLQCLPAVAARNCIIFVVCTAPSGIGSYSMGFVGPGPPSLFILISETNEGNDKLITDSR